MEECAGDCEGEIVRWVKAGRKGVFFTQFDRRLERSWTVVWRSPV